MDVVVKHNPSKQHTKGRNNRITAVHYFRAPCTQERTQQRRSVRCTQRWQREQNTCVVLVHVAVGSKRNSTREFIYPCTRNTTNRRTHEKPVVKRVFVFCSSFFYNSQCAAAVVCGAMFVSLRLFITWLRRGSGIDGQRHVYEYSRVIVDKFICTQ